MKDAPQEPPEETGDADEQPVQAQASEETPVRERGARRKRAAGGVLTFIRTFSDLVNLTNGMLLIAAIIVGVTGIFGGWQKALLGPTSTIEVPAGEEVAAAPFSLTVTDLYFTDDPGDLGFNTGDTTYLVMHVTVENTAKRYVARSTLADSIILNPLSEEITATESPISSPAVYRPDHTSMQMIQPRLVDSYIFMWELDGQTARPQELRASFFTYTWRASTLDGSYYWADRTLKAVQVLPVSTEESVK